MPEDELTNSTESEESQQQKNSEQSQTQSKPEEAILKQEVPETISDKSEPKIIDCNEPVDKEENKDPISNEPITESNKTLAAEVSPVTSELNELREKVVRLEEKLEEKNEQQDLEIEILKKQIEEVRKMASKTVPKYSPKQKREKFAPPIIPVEYLQKNGEEELQRKLGDMTNDELKNIVRGFKLKVNNIKTIQREEMITEIIKYAERELNRGSSFLKPR
jgi:hypothetical protein